MPPYNPAETLNLTILITNPSFGYIKDTDDKDKWLIDEEAAKRCGIFLTSAVTDMVRNRLQSDYREKRAYPYGMLHAKKRTATA